MTYAFIILAVLIIFGAVCLIRANQKHDKERAKHLEEYSRMLDKYSETLKKRLERLEQYK